MYVMEVMGESRISIPLLSLLGEGGRGETKLNWGIDWMKHK